MTVTDAERREVFAAMNATLSPPVPVFVLQYGPGTPAYDALTAAVPFWRAGCRPGAEGEPLPVDALEEALRRMETAAQAGGQVIDYTIKHQSRDRTAQFLARLLMHPAAVAVLCPWLAGAVPAQGGAAQPATAPGVLTATEAERLLATLESAAAPLKKALGR